MERTLGASHPTTLASRHDLAIALTGLKQHQRAAELHRQTLIARERVLGHSHPDTQSKAASITMRREKQSGRNAVGVPTPLCNTVSNVTMNDDVPRSERLLR